MINAAMQFLRNEKLLGQLNSAMISLIPKVPVPQFTSKLRPISCCNVLYKCISKVLCVRLKKALNHLVSDNQAAFVEGRLLVHNVLIMRHYNKKTSPRCLM